MHAKRKRLYGATGPAHAGIGIKASLWERLDNGVNINGPIPAHAPWLGACSVWMKSVNVTSGYGTIGYQYKKYVVHRLAWEREHGPIPDGLQVDHLCHNRRCVRVDHLRLTTPKQNNENHNGKATSRSKSGIRGVVEAPNGKFSGHVGHNNKVHYAGTFDTAAEAEEAVRQLRLELHTHNDLDRV
jgi:hypothetical protein